MTPDLAAALEPDWPISTDGPHAITEHRRWLARQLMDSKLTEEEAYGIVRHSPAISSVSPTPESRGSGSSWDQSEERPESPSGDPAFGVATGLDPAASAAARHLTTVETLFDRDGERNAYQTRVKCGPFRIHIFWRGDRDPDMHDHPATFWTFPLVSYVEEVPHRHSRGHTVWRVVRAFRLHRRAAPYPHRVLGAWTGDRNRRTGEPTFCQRPIVTLGWWGKKRREWGFHSAEGWVPWRDYVSQPGWVAPGVDAAKARLSSEASARTVKRDEP